MKFGDFVITTKKQNASRMIPAIKIGTKCVVIQEEDRPAYDLLVVPENWKWIDEDGINEHFTVYLERGSWKLV
jgi:hypothetical protein